MKKSDSGCQNVARPIGCLSETLGVYIRFDLQREVQIFNHGTPTYNWWWRDSVLHVRFETFSDKDWGWICQ